MPMVLAVDASPLTQLNAELPMYPVRRSGVLGVEL